ncbi:MAG: carboxypeptidase regulatory-like domain-containing protein [Cryomorphaceae bacterium]|nr:carboxypeptidase regulatory-like domain-containing protein [Cryomorphaceae bacterium]
MVKRILTLIMVFAVALSYGQTRPGSIKGTVKDKRTGEVIPFATVIVKDKDVVIATGTTDFDGKYNINPVNAGVYNLTCNFIGYADFNLNGVTVYSGKPKVVNFNMTVESTMIQEVTVTAPEELIETGKTSEIVTSEEIKNLPYRNLSQIVGTTAGVFQQDGSGSFNVRGSRSSTNVVFIDGVKVRGDVNLPRDAILQTEVIVGGTPAQYGDVTGGVIATTTKGPAPYYFGSSEILTSSAFDPYHYNLGALTLGGPIIRNKKTGQPIVGFLLASEFQYNRDGSPRSLTTWKVNDDKLAELQANPLVPASSGFGVLNAADFLTQGDLSSQNYRENVARTSVRFAGNLKFVTSEKTTLTVGGRYNMNQGRNGSRFNELMNYANNSESFAQDWSTYVRFQQRFGNPSDSSNSLIRNAFYSIQVDFTRNERLTQDARHKDNLFAYGHIGTFKTQYRPLYNLGSDTITDPNDPNYGKVMDAYTLAVYQSANVDYTPGENNPILSNYTSNFYDFVDQNLIFNRARSLEDIRAGGGLLNGDQPSSVYGLWGNVGANQASYGKSLNDQFRITASSTFDIKDHSLIVGVEYEQRFDRSYSVGATGLWTLMRLLQNDAIRELDLNNPIASYDNNGVFQDTLNYPRLFDADKPRTFDRNLRETLGLDPNGTDWLDIDSYDPSTFSLDMFSANELLNIGSSQYIGYYGFDYLGNRLTTRPSLTDFFATDAQGNSPRLIGAFEPIYMAGYIQDQFTYEDLFFNIGVRVDRFDANQPVLADPYVLYPAYSVGDLDFTTLAGYDVPEGISDDAVVYVDDQENPSAIVGYREGTTWYTANGEVEANPKNIADLSGGIKPFLKNPGIEDQKLAVTANESFKDYTPQVTVSPRISFQFPISDEAEFFAHYDIMVQRPDPGANRMNPITYLQLENGNNGGILSNPDLRPQRTTDYEIGFRQKLNDNSALKLSAFYREMRDMMQSFSFTEAYPVTYIAFGNLDFGTVKGYTVQYDLRRTGNVRLNANYTLQFADGTGSNSTSGANIARSGQPNLRYILPLSYDSRHQVVMNMDYRYGGGPAYNGPVWFGKRVLENAGLNLVVNANSGTPYTRRVLAYGLTDAQTPMTGNINGSRLPWSFRVDATANKVWNFNEGPLSNFEIYVQMLNVLNTQNVLGVYPYTGSPSDDGYLSSPQGQNAIQFQASAQSFADLYNISLANPGLFSLPRRIRLGLRIGL